MADHSGGKDIVANGSGADVVIPAAEYLRMSTEHQQFSLVNQTAAIRDYAKTHGLSVVRTYSDGGRSGLHLKNRPALNQLLQDVITGTHDYRAILVYDIS